MSFDPVFQIHIEFFLTILFFSIFTEAKLLFFFSISTQESLFVYNNLHI